LVYFVDFGLLVNVEEDAFESEFAPGCWAAHTVLSGLTVAGLHLTGVVAILLGTDVFVLSQG